MANAETLKTACEYVARIRLKKVAVLNYLGASTRAYNIPLLPLSGSDACC
jgi:hypothetical protein